MMLHEMSDGMEHDARTETWRAYRRWLATPRLCPPGKIDGSPERWDTLDAYYVGKAVGIVALDWGAPTSHNWSSAILVGRCLGIRNGGLGTGLCVEPFSGPGVATYRSPANLDFIHLLGGLWQRYVDLREAERQAEWEDAYW